MLIEVAMEDTGRSTQAQLPTIFMTEVAQNTAGALYSHRLRHKHNIDLALASMTYCLEEFKEPSTIRAPLGSHKSKATSVIPNQSAGQAEQTLPAI